MGARKSEHRLALPAGAVPLSRVQPNPCLRLGRDARAGRSFLRTVNYWLAG